MANPFLVLGGVAVGVITAGIGALQVPGWIDSANDSAVRSDLSQVALAQEAAMTTIGSYVSEQDLADGEVGSGATAVKSGVKFQPSDGVQLSVFRDGTNKRWAAVAQSKSGKVFIRTSDSTTVYATNAKYTDTTQIHTMEFFAPGSATALTRPLNNPTTPTYATLSTANIRFTVTGAAPGVSQTLSAVLGTGLNAGAGVTVP